VWLHFDSLGKQCPYEVLFVVSTEFNKSEVLLKSMCLCTCLGNRSVNFLVDADGQPKIAIIPAQSLRDNVAVERAKTVVSSANANKKYFSQFLS